LLPGSIKFLTAVKMDKLHAVYYLLDLAGTFAFAVSGATAARQRGLDLFGICAIAFTVACGGGIIRDVCIGAIPPAGLTTWYYLATAIFAAGMTIGLILLCKGLTGRYCCLMPPACRCLQLQERKKRFLMDIMEK
jgi:uncharacterized membrane protein YeiH